MEGFFFSPGNNYNVNIAQKCKNTLKHCLSLSLSFEAFDQDIKQDFPCFYK